MLSLPAMNPFDIAAVLIVLAAALGYVNARTVKLPSSVGLTFMGAVASLLVVAADHLMPGSRIGDLVTGFLDTVDFHTTLMNGMISFLLFAGAMHISWTEMKKGFWPILVLSTIGTVVSTLLVGVGVFYISKMIGLPVPLMWCFVFGALISPTDPVAVMAVLKHAAVPPTLSATVAGESLFNDGIGIVIFGIVLSAAMGGGNFSPAHAALDFLREAGGGIGLGLAAGFAAYVAMRGIDDYNVEVMITLAVVMGGYSLAGVLGVSGPVAMAVAGLIVGNAVVPNVMSDVTRDYVLKFWALIDEILNAVLFLLIGLELVAVSRDLRLLLVGAAAIPLVLLARLISVAGPLSLLRSSLALGPLALRTLVWGGLRGGLSVALALSLPNAEARVILLAGTYMVVLFAVLVQGGSIAPLMARWTRPTVPKIPHPPAKL